MRIALVKPPIGGILGLEMLTFVEPLGLICVAGALEAEGHECRVIDLRLDGEERGLAALAAFAPELVTVQCNSRLWRHVLQVRYRLRGRTRTYVQLGAALATRKVTWGAVRKGMNLAKVFSRPQTFLEAHRRSEAAGAAATA